MPEAAWQQRWLHLHASSQLHLSALSQRWAVQTVARRDQPQLEVSAAVVLQWESDPSVVEDTWLSQDSSAGQRALRLGGEGRWLHVPASGLSQSSGKQASYHHGNKQVASAAALCPQPLTSGWSAVGTLRSSP